VSVADLARHCREVGLANQKIPEQVELIEAIPRNDLGKIRKQDLRDRYRA
jgi:non-ribosomal peptide synthetase component E (peptide arylation enzyme)